jgi:haloalkane dehalogenase
MNKFLEDWLAFSQSVDVLPVGALLQGGTTRQLTPGEVAAYEAPYPDRSYQASPKRFPMLIPVQLRIPGAQGQPHRVLEGASHFIQEDAPDELVTIIDAFVRADPA